MVTLSPIFVAENFYEPVNISCMTFVYMTILPVTFLHVTCKAVVVIFLPLTHLTTYISGAFKPGKLGPIICYISEVIKVHICTMNREDAIWTVSHYCKGLSDHVFRINLSMQTMQTRVHSWGHWALDTSRAPSWARVHTNASHSGAPVYVSVKI